MLINKPFTKEDVVTLKLSNGEELVARFIEDNGDSVKVRKPMAIIPTQEGIRLAPYTFTMNEESFTFRKTDLRHVGNTIKDFGDQYITATTGIKLA